MISGQGGAVGPPCLALVGEYPDPRVRERLQTEIALRP